MANEEQLKRLKRSVREWNRWRKKNPDEKVDLSQADLSDAFLRSADLRDANLSKTDFSSAILFRANLNRVNLNGANLTKTNLSEANLSKANLSEANLSRANLSGADLSGADLNKASLIEAFLGYTNLSKANFIGAQVLYANFKESTLTGACIADWQLGSSTILKGVECDCIFRTYDNDIIYDLYIEQKFTGRLPIDPNSTFNPGEFEQWIAVRQGALDTIDITFTEGIDWQAFFQSLQNTRQQHPEAAVRMQAVQEVNGTYVASLQLETEIVGEPLDQLKATIESEVKASYELQLAAAQGEIFALGGKVEGLRWSLEQTLKMGSNNINQTFNAPVGNVAGTNWGNMTATINQNYGAKADDIIQLLTSLRESAQSFPDEEKETAQVHIEDLTTDLAQERPNPARLKTRIVSLLTVAIALGTHIATATDFANNVLELSQKLDVPAQTLQPQLQQLKQIHPTFEWPSAE